MDLIDPNTLAAESVSAKGAALVSVYNSITFPHDWTEGAGTLPPNGASVTATVPGAGEIDIPAPVAGKKRLWLYIQNQGTTTLPVRIQSKLADGVTDSYTTILLGPGSYVGAQGAGDERGFSAFCPQGVVKIGNTGIAALAGMQVCIMEVTE